MFNSSNFNIELVWNTVQDRAGERFWGRVLRYLEISINFFRVLMEILKRKMDFGQTKMSINFLIYIIIISE